jgi:serine/threonine-protein kinase
MSERHDPNRTVDVPSGPGDSLDAGLAAGFGPPRSSLGEMRPVLLRESQGESDHIVRPNSDAMPDKAEMGDRYQLFGEIARGGMGAVLRGRDMDLGRDLAVKVLLEKHADNPAVAQRFIEEAQIGGQLQHPGVVPVYDIGHFGNRPFFSMKLVKGLTLAAILAERADANADRPRLLNVALQVAQAVAYAHAKGVIHRDLKPANIMVGAFGEVQVMDWGLAKVLAEGGTADEERASQKHQPDEGTLIRTARSTGSAGSFGTDTEAGSLLGTPAYMPPEQANGDVANLDRRADVFGLGAILCEILTGKPPYVGRSQEEVRRKAANGDLADATARLDGCGADAELVALTKQCLSPEAIDRPKDAQSVAEGLAGYLNGVQERLHQAELAEAEARAKALEEAKRRRLTLALAGTVLLAVTLGGGGWLWIKNERDARQAQVARDVNDALNQATAFREQAKTAVVGSAALYAQAREQAQRALALVENGPVDVALVDQVTRLQAELHEEEKDRRLVAALDEAALAQSETLSDNRFATERAVPRFRAAFAAYGLPAGQGDPAAAAERIRQRPAEVQEAILAALDEWDDLASNPKLEIAEPYREWLRAVLHAAEPDDAWSRKVRAAGQEPDAARRRAALEVLAKSADATKLPARALTRLARLLPPPQAVALLRQAHAQYPADFWVNLHLGETLPFVRPPEWVEAARYLTAAVAIRPGSSGAHTNLGVILHRQGKVDEGIACHRKAIELDPKYAIAHNNLGDALRMKGDLDAAIASWRKAIELNPKDADVHSNLGLALADKGQLDEAIASCRKAVALDPKDALCHINLGIVLRDHKKDFDGAFACYRKAVEVDPMEARAHNALGHALLIDKGQIDEAIARLRKAVELAPAFAPALINLGAALKKAGQPDEAIALFRKAIEFDPKSAAAHNHLGRMLCDVKGDYDGAIALFRKATLLDPKDARAHYNVGAALARKGRVDKSVAWWRKAVELDPKIAEAHGNLGTWLSGQGRADEAIACYRKAVAADPKFAPGHFNLGITLAKKGELDEAIACYKKAVALVPTNGAYRVELAHAERLSAARDKLSAVQKGTYAPSSNEERLQLIYLCAVEKRHYTATGMYAAAFAADPKLAEDRQNHHRYNAACAAAKAAAGQGKGAPALDDEGKAKLRRQALDWLKAEVTAWTRHLESGPPQARPTIVKALRHWQKDSDLAGLRDKAALAKLSAEERAACAKLWADVAALLKKAQTPTQKEGK